MSFWIVSTVVAALVALVLAVVARRGDPDAGRTADVTVYRDQLAEIERDRARGLLPEDEAERVRAEVARRLLAADRGAATTTAARKGPALLAAGLMAAVVIGGTLLGYRHFGAPGYGDLPLQARRDALATAMASLPPQSEAEAGVAWTPPDGIDPAYLENMEKLRVIVAGRPDDLQGWTLLARNEAALGNYTAAHRAQARVVEIKGPDADATDLAALGALRVQAAQGAATQEAVAALTRALELEPGHGLATYYMGLVYLEVARPDLTFNLWAPLLETSDGTEPWAAPIREELPQIAAWAGIPYTLPEQDGPSAEDIVAMVEGLAERLANEGGPASDWARLIQSLGVLGQTDRARAIWTEAQEGFAQYPDMLETIRQAAIAAGVAE